MVVFAVAIPAFADPEPRVRSSHPRLSHLLLEGARRSATFRDLAARLQRSDVIVHVEAAPPSYALDGGLQFVTATSFVRYLRITVRTDLPNTELVGLLGHELRHAVEVADSPVIRDEVSFLHFYEAIGRPTRRNMSVTYDTPAAVEAGLRVALELRANTRRDSVGPVISEASPPRPRR